ncbi:helix-turn-helix domain-containing protein [Saccharopolyspora hattusasensis]|uniref:helix-turn-helix domain-containing protein n=1 Tax=Saccharopolyspora hattusasensis TaxID=1128679 RepID=UPI003D996FB5
MRKIPRGTRIIGARREKLAGSLRTRYERGASIRQLSEQSGRSFGAVHRMLREAGVQLRPPGGQRMRENSSPPILSCIEL